MISHQLLTYPAAAATAGRSPASCARSKTATQTATSTRRRRRDWSGVSNRSCMACGSLFDGHRLDLPGELGVAGRAVDHIEQARAFTVRLRQVSRQPVVYAELPFAQHAFDIFGSARATHAAVAVEQFLAVSRRTYSLPRREIEPPM